MKFLIMARVSAEPDAGVLPRDKLAEAMLDFDEALANAKVPVAAEGLCPGYAGARRCAGFWIIDVSSEQEAISWALRIPRVAGGEDIEIRQVNGATEIPEEMLAPERPPGQQPDYQVGQRDADLNACQLRRQAPQRGQHPPRPAFTSGRLALNRCSVRGQQRELRRHENPACRHQCDARVSGTHAGIATFTRRGA